jgi:ribosome-associated translation inhibitor RaiA
MPVPFDIVARQIVLEEPTQARIEKLVAKLETFDSQLISCLVTVDVPQRFPSGRPVEFQVGLRLSVPGENLEIRRQRAPDLEQAVQAAFAAAGRRLQDAARRRRGDIKRRAVPVHSGG